MDPVRSGERRLDAQLETLHLPPGFAIELYTDEVPDARSLALGPPGVVFVGSKGERVYAVVDADRDGRVDEVLTVADGLDTPNGVAYRDGDLYVGEISRILRFTGIDARLREPGQPTVVFAGLPDDPHHGRRFIRFGPDGRLYVGVGAPCNVCDPALPAASIARLSVEDPDPRLDIYATGIRNTVGFDWDPSDGALWFTDNGRDGLGDNVPPDELDRAPTAGLDFGFPHCHGGFLLDPQFGDGHDCDAFVEPAARLGPHVAALGMRFYTGEQFPAVYRDSPIIAEHGSWDRSVAIGYRVVVALLAPPPHRAQVVGVEPLVEGFVDAATGEAWGRPVDVEVLDDGSLLISDDLRGAIYRLRGTG